MSEENKTETTTATDGAAAEKPVQTTAVKYWTNDDGREIPTRDATKSEELSLGMYEEDTTQGTMGDPYDCAIAIKIGMLPNVMLTTREKRKEFGLKIGHKLAIIPIIDESSPVGYTRLRFHRMRREKLTKQFDTTGKAAATFVHLRVPEGKRVAANSAVRKPKAKTKTPKHKKKAAARRAPERAGFRERTHAVGVMA